MIEVPVDNTPCKSFSFGTPEGAFRFRTYWSNLASTWFLDVINSDDSVLLAGIALVTGCNNLLQGTGLDLFKGKALFVIDASGNGNRTFDGFGTDAKLYMTMTGEVYLPYG